MSFAIRGPAGQLVARGRPADVRVPGRPLHGALVQREATDVHSRVHRPVSAVHFEESMTLFGRPESFEPTPEAATFAFAFQIGGHLDAINELEGL